MEYDNNEFLENYFDLDSTKLNFKGAFLQDALLALAVTKVLFDEVDYELMNSFKRDAHRQEEITDKKDRLWVNDSKATNVDASIQAIKTYDDKKIHLILGGDDKEADLNPLFDEIKKSDIIIYAIGKNSLKLLDLAKKYNIKAIESITLQNAIVQIDKTHTKSSIALLSPASASFDQFKSYKDRGEQFMDRVLNIE